MGDAAPHAPEVGQGAVVPQLAPIGCLVQFGDAYAVFVGRYVLGYDVHSHLAEVEVGADAGGSGDARLAQHVANHATSQLVGRYLVCFQVVGHIHEHLVDGVDVNVLGCHILRVDAVDAGAVVDIVGHTRRCHVVGDRQRRIGFQLVVVGRLAKELTIRCFVAPLSIHLAHPLHHLEQSCASADAVLLQRRGHRQTDGLLGAALVGHYKIGCQRVQSPLDALDRGVERLEVDGYVLAVGRHNDG